MKKTSRLFVLLLALCVMMTSMPLLSLAEETVAETTMDQATESVEEEVLAEEPVLEIEPEVIPEVIQQTEPEVTTEAVPEDEQGFTESVDAEETTSTEATAETQEVEAPATEDDTTEEETPAEPIAEEGEVETEEEGEEESPADEEEAPGDEEPAEEAESEEDEPTDTRSIEGYATVLAGTTVYTDAMRQEKLGEFKTSETVYAVTIQQMDRVENDLIWIGFDTEARRNAGESTLGGFVYGKDIRKISDEQQSQIAAQLEKDEDAREVSVYGKGVKRLVSCVAFAMEEKATESTEGDDEGEQTEAVETTPEEPEDESADEPEDEKVEILDTHTASGIVSLVPSNTTVTMKNDMSFTIQTETGYAYVAMYSEQGTFVNSWTSSQYSKLSNGVRVWTIPYAFQSSGSRSVTFKAGKSSSSLTSTWTVNINVLPIPSVTGISAPGSVLAQNNMTLTVTTSKNAYYLRMYSETGAVAKTWSTSDSTYRDSGDNRIWTVQYAIQTPGARTLTLKSSVNNREYGTGRSFNVNVAGVTSVTASTTSALVGTPITFTVKTSVGSNYIALCAEDGHVVKSWSLSSNGVSSNAVEITWSVSYSFSNSGNRTIYFKASTDGKTYGGAKAIALSIRTSQMLKSVTPEFAAVTAQNNLKITAETTTDASYIAMFAEDGYRVCYWTAGQSSVVSNGTRKWTLNYAFQNPGTRKLTFKAGPTLNTLGDPKTINLTVMEIPRISTLTAPSSVVAENEMTIRVITPKNAYYLALYAENNSFVRSWSTSSGVHQDNASTRVWTIKYTIMNAGKRNLSMKASVNNKQYGPAYAFTVNATVGKKVTAVSAPSSATVGVPVTFTVKTETGVKNISLFSETGALAGNWTSGYTTSGSVMTWTVKYTFQNEGNRKLYFRASGDGTNYGSAMSFALTVEKQPTLSITSASVTGTTVTLKWNQVTGATYNVLVGKKGSTKTQYATGISATTYQVTNLEKNTAYAFQIQAKKNGTVVATSPEVTATTGDYTPGTTYRALLIGEVNFDPICNRNWGDVNLMSSMLSSRQGANGGWYSIVTKKNQTPSQILSAISSTFANADSDDVSLFFIATHGDASSSGTYAGALATVDSSGNESFLLMYQLANALNAIPGKVIVILESCGSGAAVYDPSVAQNNVNSFTSSAISAFAALDGGIAIEESEVEFDDDGVVIMESHETGEFRKSKFYVLAASRYLQLSWGTESTYQGGPYNYFTYDLTRGVGTSGSMPADTNSNGIVTLNELFTYIKTYGDSRSFSYQGSTVHQNVQVYPTGSSYGLFKK